MKLEYASIKNEDMFVLTDFNCQPSLELLVKPGMYKILWSYDRLIEVVIDGYKVSLEKDNVLFCTPLNKIELPKNNEGMYAFVFNKEFFCIQTHDEHVSCNGLLFFGSSDPQVVKLDQENKRRFSLILEFLKEEFIIKDHVQGEMLRSLLKRLLIVSTRLVSGSLKEPDMPNAQMEVIRQFNLLVEQHFREMHQVQEYANLLFKSPKTLSNFFKKYGEKSPLGIITDRIILEAKRLLLYSDKSIEEIAFELGYQDAGVFSKIFKKKEDTSPSAYRKQWMAHA